MAPFRLYLAPPVGVGIMIDELLVVLLGFWVCRARRSLAAHADADRDADGVGESRTGKAPRPSREPPASVAVM